MCSEFDIIRRYFTRPTPNTLLGIGDDAALLAYNATSELAIATDTMVSGKHFFPDMNPRKLGYKSLAVNLSDMAAMGATPRWAMLALTIPKSLLSTDKNWLDDFAEGFFELADIHQVELIGGDTTCGPLNICVQIIGEVAKGKAMRRSNARPGDDIWVSGYLGDAALALAQQQQLITLESNEIEQCLPALLTPKARIELGQRLCGLVHSAIDISDGLIADLGHILKSSSVAATVYMDDIACSNVMKKYLPQAVAVNCVLAGGDDYELCFTASEENRKNIEIVADELAIPLTRIGKIIKGSGLMVKDQHGNEIILKEKGYDHFRS